MRSSQPFQMPAQTVTAANANLSPFPAQNWLPWQHPVRHHDDYDDDDDDDDVEILALKLSILIKLATSKML